MPSDDVTLPQPPPPADPPASRRRWLEAVGLILGLTALLVVAALWSQPAPRGDADGQADAFDVVRVAPAPAPDLELAGLDGKTVRLADFRGRVVFLNFWATWCPPCREEMPAMQALAGELEKEGLVVLAVNYAESAETAEAFIRETGLTLPVLLDPDGAVTRRFRVTALPASFFVDRRGALVGSVLGIRDWQGTAARRYIEGLLRPAG
jgi:thiol-disulfide isomerase/thioredoxin